MTGMASGGSDFYYGSRLLEPLCPYVRLSIDKLNFLICQLLAIGVALAFRKRWAPARMNATSRNAVEIVGGVALTTFCFGHQASHLLFLSTASYCLMLFGPTRLVPVAVYLVAMVHMSVLHIHRQIHDYAGYTLDVTGPMMILFQKVTSLAFALHDGAAVDGSKLTQDQRTQAVRTMPSLLEYYSYCFCFHNILCGPHVFYKDFDDFIRGRVPESKDMPSKKEPDTYWSPGVNVAMQKIATCILSGAVMMFVTPHFVIYITGTAFLDANFLYKMLYLIFVLPLVRCKYYFAWTLGELVNMAAGLGFSGHDYQGNEKWDIIQSAKIVDIELSLSVKDVINGWNIPTTVWLRRCIYDRLSANWRTTAVFVCSAFWHGFYPGYYFTFGTAALILHAARNVRQAVRPSFLHNRSAKLLYDSLTFVFTRLASSYLGTPFVLYSFEATAAFYRSMYWWMHIGAAGCLLVLPWLPSFPQQRKLENGQTKAPPQAQSRQRDDDDKQG